jgi:hypothetical protein
VSGFWAPEGHPYPELKESIENLNKAIFKGPEEEAKAARAVDDLMLEKWTRRPLLFSNVVFAAGPRVESYQNIPGQYWAFRLEYLKLKQK